MFWDMMLGASMQSSRKPALGVGDVAKLCIPIYIKKLASQTMILMISPAVAYVDVWLCRLSECRGAVTVGTLHA
jgi:hypothetical protein